VATERSRQLVLAALTIILAVVIVQMWPGTSTAPDPTSNRAETPQPSRPGQRVGSAAGPPVVHLEALQSEPPKPESVQRNLFRFVQKAPPPPPAVAIRPVPPPPVVPTGPPPPPPLAPIALKFIGIVEAPSHGEKIAILSDGRNAPFYGKEGAIIEGRYRILKIGVESVELAYADGRGRQTIRLTGS
jgi:hypothetical protein